MCVEKDLCLYNPRICRIIMEWVCISLDATEKPRMIEGTMNEAIISEDHLLFSTAEDER